MLHESDKVVKQLKMYKKKTKMMNLTLYLMTFLLIYEHVSSVEYAPDDSSEGTPIFEVEIKGALGVATKLQLNMHMLVPFLIQNSSQNHPIKGERGETLLKVH